MLNNKKSSKYYNKRAVCNVLSGLFNNVKLFNDTRYNLNEEDFVNKLHRTLYVCLYNLANQGLEQIGIADIEAYLSKNNMVAYKLLIEEPDNLEWLGLIKENTSDTNFDYYYTQVKKMSLLRGYIDAGIDVTGLLDKNEIDVTLVKMQEEKLDRMSLQDIMKYFDAKMLGVKEKFATRSSSDSRKAGENSKAILEDMLKSPSFGLTTESEYLNTISYGFCKKKYWVESRNSGTGKSRNSILRIINACCREVYNEKTAKWEIINNHPVSAIYINTELDLEKEVELMFWAFIAKVREDKIRRNVLTEAEKNRILKAIDILNEANIYLETQSDYDTLFIKNTIEKYKAQDDNIALVIIDYIELNSGLIAEWYEKGKGIMREDLVLLELSKVLKDYANQYEITIIGYTQVTLSNQQGEEIYDQRLIKGSKAIINKADIGIVSLKPSNKQLELLKDAIDRKKRNLNINKEPNLIMNLYKNRGGAITNVKIWIYQDLGLGNITEFFCTDENYNILSIEKTKILMELE